LASTTARPPVSGPASPARPDKTEPKQTAVEPYRLTPKRARRVALLSGLVIIGFVALILRLWALQVLAGPQYAARAQANQVRTVRVEAPRGPIVDRNNNVLVTNRQVTRKLPLARSCNGQYPSILPRGGQPEDACERAHELSCATRTTTTSTGGFVALTWIRTHDWDVDAWRGRSACRDSDPDIFFPIGSTGPALEQIETALAGGADQDVQGRWLHAARTPLACGGAEGASAIFGSRARPSRRTRAVRARMRRSSHSERCLM